MPTFVKDEKKWEKAKSISKKIGNKKGTQSFWKFATYMYFKLEDKKNESWNTTDMSTQSTGYIVNGPTAYPKMMSSTLEKYKEIEDENISDFKTWFDKIDKQSESDKMLTRIKKNKFDTTKEKHTIPGSSKSIFSKKDNVTVWGSPEDYNYIRN